RRAYHFARKMHAKIKRRSGEPYITHPLAVAQILAELEMDIQTLCAGLLHDVVEDTKVTREDIEKMFSKEIADLVDGVTKLQKVAKDEFAINTLVDDDDEEPLEPHEEARKQRLQEQTKNAANMRKFFMFMAQDLRVIVVKLADRLHNMRTLSSMLEHKRLRIARETLQVYAPLSHRLGIGQIKWELEDLAFKYSEPEEFNRIANQVAQTRDERQGEVDEAISILKERLQAEGIPDAYVMGRPKHLWSIYQKMLKQELDFTDLFDLVAVRIIVHTKPQCYHALGIVSGIWTPMPGMYSDYIAQGKSNMYQSLHLKVIGPHLRPLEIQIRTWEMHRTAEFGVAAHWAYKEKGEGGKVTDQFEKKLNWLRQQIFDLQNEAKEPGEFLRGANDLFADQVFVFTPKGDIFDMPVGATPIDFAYRIHSNVGDRTVLAKVNSKIVPLGHELSNGDVVEVQTRTDAHPSRDWLSLAKTTHARSKIKAYFKKTNHGDNVELGRESLVREAERLGLDAHTLLKDENLRSVAEHFNVPSEDELLAAVGYGTISSSSVVHRLQPNPQLAPKGLVLGKGRADDSKLKVKTGDIDNVLIRRSRCCQPIPGDEVVGYVTRGRGITLHRKECPNIKQYEKDVVENQRLTPVEYTGGDNQVYSVSLIIDCSDRTGLLADVGNIFGEQKTFITAINTRSFADGTAKFEISAEVRDVEHLAKVFLSVRRLTDVLDIDRRMGGKGK
ncbi:MAG: bifunctional (p)ppGpp synthetase/guanosine-3',5'-bis(diphosphate) 3'-pyrophosphohydrolase, partial [Chthonomonadales bacterium]